jgi:uncharacterized protein (TIRG00374 family)
MKRPVLQALALSVALSTLGLGVIAWQVGGLETFLRIRYLDPIHLALAVAALYASYSIAAVRLQLICHLLNERLRHRHALRANLLGIFAAAVTPGGSGGAPGLAITLDVQGIERHRAWAAALATVSADVVFHAWATPLALGVLYAVGLYPRTPLWTALAIGATGVTAAMAYLLLFRIDRLDPLLKSILRGPLLRFRRAGIRFVQRFLEANRLVATASAASRFQLQALTAVAWFSMFAVLLFIVRGLGAELGAVVALAGQTVLMVIASVFPTPGGSGFLELALSWFLVRQGSGEVVTAAVLAWRLLTFYSIFLIGPMLGGYLIVKAASAPAESDVKERVER